MKRVVGILLLLFSTLQIFAETDSLDYNAANKLYENKNYSQAIHAYENILRYKGASAEIYYNLGNAYYKNGQMGKAIVNYERSLKIRPGDDDAVFNLQLANLRIKDRLQPVNELFILKRWKEFISICTANTWSLLTIFCIWIALIGFGIYRLIRNYTARKSGLYICIASFVLFIFLLIVTLSKNAYDRKNHFAIITAPSQTVKSGPNESETNLFLIHEGLKIRILYSDNTWTKIKMEDGNEGWVLNASIEEI